MKTITSEELEKMMANNEKILVDFYADWCGPCKSLIPRLENFESNFENVKFVKINVDENQSYAIKKGIRSVPTIMFYDGYSLINSSSGIQSDDFYKNFLNQLNV